MKGKRTCSKCKRTYRTRKVIKFHGKMLCFYCRQKTRKGKSMKSAGTSGHLRPKTLEATLKKVYDIKTAISNEGYAYGYLYLPRCMIGKKVKLVMDNE